MSEVLKLFMVSFLFLSCASSVLEKDTIHKEEQFIYLSHTRHDDNDKVFDKIYNLDLSKYAYILLGGDLAMSSFENDAIIRHLDSIFDLQSKKTLWSIGNHDQTSDDVFFKHTGKSKYGIYQNKDVSFITLNSQDSYSSIVGKQKEFLNNVLDSISSEKIIIMTHKLIFMDQHPVMDSQINKICNGKKGDCFYCHNTNNFQKEIYPRLLTLRKKGKKVIWIGGDLGYKVSSFEFIDENGVVFLGNGVWYQKENNKALVFHNSKDLTYQFVKIDSLSQIID